MHDVSELSLRVSTGVWQRVKLLSAHQAVMTGVPPVKKSRLPQSACDSLLGGDLLAGIEWHGKSSRKGGCRPREARAIRCGADVGVRMHVCVVPNVEGRNVNTPGSDFVERETRSRIATIDVKTEYNFNVGYNQSK